MTTSSLESEQAVIGSILLDDRCIPLVEAQLRVEDFALEAYRKIYRAAVSLAREGKPVDPVMILEAARDQHAGVSREYLMQLMEITPTAANVEAYAAQVREESLRRSVDALGKALQDRIEQRDETAAILADAARQVEEDLQTSGVAGDLLDPTEALMAFYDHRQQVEEGKASGFVPTGYRDIDILLGGGMISSGMYVLRPAGHGQDHGGHQYRGPGSGADRAGALFSLEMDEEQIMAKRISRVSASRATGC